MLDSRTNTDSIRRRRLCASCGHRFTTYERIEQRVGLVHKRDGSTEPFSPEKLLDGIVLACRKRPVTQAQMEGIVRTVQADLSQLAKVKTSDVGEAVLAAMRELDEVAYVRFASVYKAFDSAEQFAKALSTS